jgi:hypothetical protein
MHNLGKKVREHKKKKRVIIVDFCKKKQVG